MHWMMTLAQVNPLSNETIETLANSRSDTLALLALLGMIFLGVIIARIVGRGIDRQNDALASERAERQKLQGALDTQRLRTTALEDKLDKIQTAHLQAQHDAQKERDRWTARIEEAERKLREQEKAFNDERARTNETVARLTGELETLRKELSEEREGSMALYAENEKLRTERDQLLKRVEDLEKRIDELSARVDKRATGEHPTPDGTPESKIETAELNGAGAQTRILDDVQKSLQNSGDE